MTTLVVDDYARAIAFFVDGLGFKLVENTALSPEKSWVVVEAGAGRILLAKAAGPQQAARVGDQTGGRVAFFLHSENFDADAARIVAAGGCFLESPRQEPYGKVAKFTDPWGNRWDLIAPHRPPPDSKY